MPLHEESLKAVKYITEVSPNKKIVFVSGNFNIIHPGHLRLIRFAKECGDFLVVGVLDSKSEGTMIKEDLRLEGIRAISWVDYGFILHDQPESFIEELRPAFVVKGKEHEDKYNSEAETIVKIGGKLLFSSGDTTFSSIDLIKKEWKELILSSIKKPIDFPSRHGFDMDKLIDAINQMSKLKVCVLGDTIVDEYITCDPIGMSQEDPTIVVTPLLKERFVGGAAIVAAHASSLGAETWFSTVTGKDEASDFVKKEMEKYSIKFYSYKDESRPTTIKQRYRTENKTLLRVNHLKQHTINGEISMGLLKKVSDILNEIDLLIFADFNYGCLPQYLVDNIVNECSKRGIMMVADSQSSSQIGDISRFYGMALITPTEREARLALHDFNSGLVVLAERLRQKCMARNVILTLGAEGILMHAETKERNDWLTDRLPAMNTAPKDVAGAGDSFLICAAMSLVAGADIWQSAYLGSLAAACQVGRIGNIPLSLDELKKEIKN